VASSDEPNRADQKNMTLANEYMDGDDVLNAKLDVPHRKCKSHIFQLIVDLIKKSKNLVAYTGAGLSKASGIGDYASKSKESVVKVLHFWNYSHALFLGSKDTYWFRRSANFRTPKPGCTPCSRISEALGSTESRWVEHCAN
jgi:hypothetical protein